MNYVEGKLYMLALTEALKNTGQIEGNFRRGNLLISYPGRKKKGDYRLSENRVVPTHIDVVREIYNFTTAANFREVSDFLDDVYTNGLNAATATFPYTFVEKIYWITLQEEINYPPPKSGRKLPFQRYYEAALAKIGVCDLISVCQRTNNHGKGRPPLYQILNRHCPSFYK